MVIGNADTGRQHLPQLRRRTTAAGIAFLVACLLFLMPDGPALPASLTLQTSSVPGLDPKKPLLSHVVRLTGAIEPRDSERLRGMLTTLRSSTIRSSGIPLATLELSSSGGDLLEGIRIGYLLREFEVATLVRKGDACMSACALVFLGGTSASVLPAPVPDRRIEIGGQVGFHTYTTDPSAVSGAARGDATALVARAFGLARAGASTLVRFAADMGVDIDFIADIISRPPDQWRYVQTTEDFLNAGACPVGSLPSPPLPERQAANICNHATGWSRPADPSQARPISIPESRRHLLEAVHANVASYKMSGPLAAQLAALIASRDQRLVEAVYADLRAAGIPLLDHSGRTFVVDGYASGALALHCHVSLSPTVPERYDLVLMAPTALQKAFHPPPAACPELFRYERQEVLNPRR